MRIYKSQCKVQIIIKPLDGKCDTDTILKYDNCNLNEFTFYDFWLFIL